jgi:cyclophilin family peptidyl-prolyl cis-trans isomerase
MGGVSVRGCGLRVVSRLARIVALLVLASAAGSACTNREQKEAALTQECQKEPPCKNHGLCSGSCEGDVCKCIAARDADCAATMACVSGGVCTARAGKCVIGGLVDCQKAAICAAGAKCTFKDGACVIGGDADCRQSELCKTSKRCVARGDSCVDPSTDMTALLNPNKAAEPCPDKFRVKFVTSRGEFVVEAYKAWAPLGVERFYNLARINFYADTAFFRVIGGFVAHFGIHGNHEVSAAWRENLIRDDPPAKQSNVRGTVSFAANGPHSRSTEVFINLGANHKFDKAGFQPIGKVVQGLAVVEALNKEYGESPPNGKGPEAARIQLDGASYLKKNFPNLDTIKSASLL